MVTPSSPVFVHVGGIVYFSTTSKELGSELKWISEDQRILEISDSGKAVALKEGKTNIMISDSIHYLTKVFVYKSNKILLNEAKSPSKITSIYNSPHYREKYYFYFRVVSDAREVKVLDSHEMNTEDPINNNLKFDCECEENELFQAKGEIKYEEFEKQQLPVCIIAVRKYTGVHYVKIII